jgi:3-dehydroquinate dehydratase I
MRPCVESPFSVRGLEYGGAKPLFCVPLVAQDLASLITQAEVAHDASADLIEWRADFSQEISAGKFVEHLGGLRLVLKREPIIFTLRSKAEGGAQEIPQDTRRECIIAVLRSGLADIVDIELSNEPSIQEPVLREARAQGVRILLSAHDFHNTPSNDDLLEKISAMNRLGADIAKIAVMPRTATDVLRLMQVTLEARKCFPRLALCTMSMGSVGAISRIAGFLYGSDMSFAVGQTASAPGQIPIADARAMVDKLLRYS